MSTNWQWKIIEEKQVYLQDDTSRFISRFRPMKPEMINNSKPEPKQFNPRPKTTVNQS